MSLVGTRPILQDELRQYELHHRARIAIKSKLIKVLCCIESFTFSKYRIKTRDFLV